MESSDLTELLWELPDDLHRTYRELGNTALYAGSAESILDKCFAPEATNSKMAQFGPEVNQRYGAVKSVEFAGESEEQYGTTRKAWIVTCERGSFRLQLMMTKEGQIMGIWVDPATK